ncbi:hypothetical protein J4457_06095, partial [Candidatus Woesearchaeota archaeon]|nr:hypothetical protein [Candidatus Woesearchaeota archaeon]
EIVKRQIRIVHFENREGRNLLRNIRELFETIEQQARRLTVKILPNIEHGLETFEHERYQENMGRIIGRTATLTQVIQFLDGMITAVSSCLLAKPEAQKFFEAHDKLVRTTTTLNEAIDRELRGIVELEKADNYWKELIG